MNLEPSTPAETDTVSAGQPPCCGLLQGLEPGVKPCPDDSLPRIIEMLRGLGAAPVCRYCFARSRLPIGDRIYRRIATALPVRIQVES